MLSAIMPCNLRSLSFAALVLLIASHAETTNTCDETRPSRETDVTSLLSNRPQISRPVAGASIESYQIEDSETLPEALAGIDVEVVAPSQKLPENQSHVALLGLNVSLPHLPHFHMPGADVIDQETMQQRGEYYRQHMGLSQNKAGDLPAFLTALLINSAVVVGMAMAASFLRLQFPDVYSANTLGDNPRVKVFEEEKAGFFGWIHAARRIVQDVNLVEASVGLDHCMLLEYTKLAMKIMLVVGVPHILILAPLHRFFGGVNAHLGVDEETGLAIEADHLSSIGFANVEMGSSLCWIHGFAVWFVVCATQWLIFEAQRKFMLRRIAWLKRIPFPRSNTVLVECIEPEYRSDKKLKQYFNRVFAQEDCVHEAYVVRDTTTVLALKGKLEENQQLLREAQSSLRGSGGVEDGEQPSARPRHRVSTHLNLLGEEVDSIDFFSEKVSTLEGELAAERERIQKAVAEGELDSSIFCASGFVTFKKRVNCEHALKHNFSADMDAFVVSIPPHPSDVSYPALQVESHVEAGRNLLGYAGVAGIFFFFLPLVIAVSSMTSMDNLKNWDVFARLVAAHPGVEQVWDGIVASVLLTVLMGFVPTFLVLVFESFYSLKAQMWMQHKVQQWYFYFLVVFVLLVTGIGSSLASAFRDLIADPTSVFWRIADAMPLTTHFYLNFFPTQAAAHAGFLTRNAPLAKYMALRPILGAERAKELSEPEAQCFYGIGSRSATFSLLLVTALVFSTLSPLICVLCFLFFALAKIVYANLFLFAETSKPDLGGVFWVTSLKHTQQGLFIYVTLMTGVLLHRAKTCGPGVIAAASFAVLVPSYSRFERAFLWECLPFSSVQTADAELPKLTPGAGGSSQKAPNLRYAQEELCEKAAKP